ncbi:hypothetical protein IX39_03140 [Chryseobacterium formosense]|uniref:DUF5683 domain-containing protein n=1 Tax=Chryseobacterium formosense TaxID=236814 RepID=A0A085Z5G1_9FLAO|nr:MULTISPECIES: DUF5683 domain-containing protein [Chryseobacterium]KFE99674.1 hypothetical protein IX39_03140 [Chryseobacterium formosense]OCK52103.1 hypothetical protein BA768_14355 [Chryseobacterium sp. CBo1]SFT79367.1 hypothetical protein SAMN05421857_3263 [Chryseobacterium formosense]
MKNLLFTFFLLFSGLIFSQINPRDTIRLEHYATDSIPAAKPQAPAEVIQKIEKANAPASVLKVKKLNPTKAGLYSAVFPGLGQVYNKKYWKVPIVWGAVGTGVGIAIWNQNRYKEYREYYIAKLNGTPNEFLSQYPNLDATALGNAQDRSKRQRDYAIAITGLIYILNIVDAVVDAHLYEGRKDPDLTFAPAVIYDDYNINPPKTGLALSFRF